MWGVQDARGHGAPSVAGSAAGDVPLFQFPLTKTWAGLVNAKPSAVGCLQ